MGYWITEEYVRVSVAERTPRPIPHYVAPPRRRPNDGPTLRALAGQAIVRLREALIGAPVLRPAAPHTRTR